MELQPILLSIIAGLLAILGSIIGTIVVWGVNKICNSLEKKVDRDECDLKHQLVEMEIGTLKKQPGNGDARVSIG